MNVLLLAVIGYFAYSYFYKPQEYFANPQIQLNLGGGRTATGTINVGAARIYTPRPRPRATVVRR